MSTRRFMLPSHHEGGTGTLRRQVLKGVVPIVAVLGLLPWAGAAGSAEKATQKQSQATITDAAGRTHTITKKVTPAERQGAADRLKALKDKAAAAALAAPLAAPVAAPVAAALAAPAGGYLVGPNNQLVPDYSGMVANWAYSPTLAKFADPLPGLYISGISSTPPPAKYIPVAQPQPSPVGTEGTSVDYYEIELGEYNTWSFHSGLPNNTKLRGYRQTNATDPNVGVFSYLGPLILAQKGKPVRIKFTNNLPSGAGGNLYIPVDATVLGAGPGPTVSDATRLAVPADVLCMPDALGVIPADCYPQNRATIHLHGGVTPWISDGTTHQWITPAGEALTRPPAYLNGVSVYNVPDMPNPGAPGSATNPAGSGSQTFYYTNDQAARLMFYHDHAMGITRLNVYVGEAAGYLLRDNAEAGLETAGLIPGLLDNIPLVIQEKAFVDAATIGTTDPTWNWGTGAATPYTDPTGKTIQLRAPVTGDLWWPHVYQPAQNPYDLSGYNATGRWNYGPWFFPPTPIPYGPVPNPYYQPDCGLVPPGAGCTEPWQPFMIPGTPNPSWGAEAFLDTPVINGTAYPALTVEAKPYRFRILNAGGDRFVNLQLYLAADKKSPTTEGTIGAVMCDGTTGVPTADCTEVKMVPAAVNTGLPPNWPQDGRAGGVPDPATAGPSFVVIGTEGGFLPFPVVVAPQPVVWNGDPLTFNFGNVSDFSLLLGPAERADAIVDFSGLAGKTFILYNDAPAAFPALDPRNDYYTGNPDQTATGGAVSTLPGMGPNTRTLMQINVVPAVSPGITFSLPALEAAFTTDPVAGTTGVFKASQDDVIVAQSDKVIGHPGYDKAYGMTYPSTAPWWGLGSIFDSNVRFVTVAGAQKTLLAQPKAIHDEMGATFDDYGRMKAQLGVQMPNPTPNLANFIMQGYADPSTELVKLVSTPIGDPMTDGTQIWRVNHNGVDTHPIHFHLFHVQVVNRVGWDGAYRPPHPTELGWKDTVRISPLEDTYVALRPIAPRPESLPFKIPNSFRPLDPTLPIGSTLGFSNIDPLGRPIVPGLTNQVANFGWEYVWHCHILAHEENDMMRAVVFATTPETPTAGTSSTVAAPLSVTLSWTDNSLTANAFKVQRATSPLFAAPVTFQSAAPPCTDPLGCARSYTDTDPALLGVTTYYYRVYATNTVGSGVPNYPSITSESLPTATFTVTTPATPPAAPTGLTAMPTGANQITLSWNAYVSPPTSPALNLEVWRNNVLLAGGLALNAASYIDNTVVSGTTYTYQVFAVNAAGSTGSNLVTVTAGPPAAPTNLTFGARTQTTQIVNWIDASNNENGFTVQRATNNGFSQNVVTLTTGPNVGTVQFTGLTRNTRYYYRVRAFNGAGTSGWSNTINQRTLP